MHYRFNRHIIRGPILGLFTLVTLSACPGSPAGPAANPTAPPPSEARTSPAATPATGTPSSSPTASATEASDLTIVPEQRFGPIGAESSEESLKATFGADQVKREKMYVGDGQEWEGLAIFPSQPEKRVEVFWFEEDPTRVKMIQISGEKSQWKTAQGVTLGTTLQELQNLNGKPFKILGLGWDFGGSVADWNGGALQGLTLRCDSTSVELSEEESAAISGDKTVMSDLPAMQKANPRVSKIVVNFSLPEASPTP